MKYRIIEQTNSLTKEKEYIVQEKIIFWWFNCTVEELFGSKQTASFDNFEAAEEYKKVQEEYDAKVIKKVII